MNEENTSFSAEELLRYSRHITIPQFGLSAQHALKKAKVLVIGAGGLGSPLLLYLAASGVGTIGIVDFDVVDESNLQRQVLFTIHDLGKPKAEVAKERLAALNQHLLVKTYPTKLVAANADSILKDYDVIADCSDNFPTRYLVNDACVLLGKPYVYASIYRFEGQVSVFNYTTKDGSTGPNYRDLYLTPPTGINLNCAESGVLGVLPGIIGSIQALEVIKLVTGIGQSLSGKLFVFDTLAFESSTFSIQKNRANPLTGATPTITTFIDYEEFCGVKSIEPTIKNVAPAVLADWIKGGEDIQIIDVREPYEYAIVNIGGELISLNTVADNSEKISHHKKVIIHCKSGGRSMQAIQELEEKFGFTNLYNLEGGLIRYIDEVRPDLVKY